MAEKRVIDISYHNGEIDFNALSKTVDNVIIRCGYGDNYSKQDDVMFSKYMGAAISAGMNIGIYIYSYAKSTTQAASEANHVIRLIEPYKTYTRLSKVVWYDVEENYQIPLAQRLFNTFKSNIEDYGFTAGLYMSESFFNQSYPVGLKGVPCWIAKYGTNNGKPNTAPKCNCDISLWQYTSVGKVNGVGGNVDLSICYDDTIFSNRGRITDFDTAMRLLVEKGAISSPDYWYNAAKVVNYLPDLIINMANTL